MWLCGVLAGINTNTRLQLCRGLPPFTALNGHIMFACVLKCQSERPVGSFMADTGHFHLSHPDLRDI